MDSIPLAMPILQIFKCTTYKRQRLRVDTTVQRSEMFKNADRYQQSDLSKCLPLMLTNSTPATSRISVSEAMGCDSKTRAPRLEESSRSKRGLPVPRLTLIISGSPSHHRLTDDRANNSLARFGPKLLNHALQRLYALQYRQACREHDADSCRDPCARRDHMVAMHFGSRRIE